MSKAPRLSAVASTLVLALGLALVGACSGDPSGPVATTLQVSLTSPYPDDGALLFTVTGGPVDSVEASGLTLYTSRPQPTTLQVILTGDVSSGNIARLHIPDAQLGRRYSVTLQQAAARGSYSQRDPASYQLRLTP
jgi:hypothetical protein